MLRSTWTCVSLCLCCVCVHYFQVVLIGRSAGVSLLSHTSQQLVDQSDGAPPGLKGPFIRSTRGFFRQILASSCELICSFVSKS